MSVIRDIISEGQLISVPFQQIDTAASQSNVALGLTDSSIVDDVMPFDGEVVAVTVRATAARTGGTLDVEPTIDGSVIGMVAQLDATNTQSKSTTQPRETDRFSAGSRIGCNVTTDGSWAPVTADIRATVFVILYLDGI